MNILVTGGTGFVGSQLTLELLREGHMLKIVTRTPKKYSNSKAKNQQFVSWDAELKKHMDWADAVINLAGESIFGQRWSKSVKDKIYNSRIRGTRQLVEAMHESADPPAVFISASAAGYYGDTAGEVVDESSEPGSDFLARVCQDWEKEAKQAPGTVRLVIPRLGIVLEKGGGALQQMILPFKLFAGGPVGSGDQYVPWIHMTDLIDALKFAMRKEQIEGIYNVNAPNPVTMRTLADEIGAQINRPSWLRVPESVLKLVLGEAAEPILASLNVSSEKIRQTGYEFNYENIELALADILNR